MICYRDTTWCEYYKECSQGEKCSRALTQKVKEDAEKWMKNAPICVFAEKPECFKEIKND